MRWRELLVIIPGERVNKYGRSKHSFTSALGGHPGLSRRQSVAQRSSGIRPIQILAHFGDLLDWACRHAQGKSEWHTSKPLPWDQEVVRFFAALDKFDKHLASTTELGCPPEKLFQGPIADALTHVGQIAMLRRMSGSPIKGENYYGADIAEGRVGPEQSPPGFEFD